MKHAIVKLDEKTGVTAGGTPVAVARLPASGLAIPAANAGFDNRRRRLANLNSICCTNPAIWPVQMI